MKKGLIAIVVMVFVFAGCANTNNSNEYSLVNNTPDPEQSIEGEETATPTVKPDKTPKPVAKKNHSGLQQVSMINNNSGCSTEKGYYYLDTVLGQEMSSTNPFCIFYIDYDTKEQKYLCSQPTCKHNVAECESNVQPLAEHSFDRTLFTDNEYLYILVSSMDAGDVIRKTMIEGTDEDHNIYPTALYRVKLKGSKVEKVYEFKQWETVNKEVFYDGANLIMLKKKLKCNPVDEMDISLEAESAEVIQLSLKDFTCTTVKEIDPQLNAVGCAGNSLVLVKEEYDQEEPSGTLKEYGFDAIVDVYSLELSSKELTPIKRIEDKGVKTYAVADDSFFYAVGGSFVIKKISLRTRQETVFVESDYDRILGLADEYLFCQIEPGSTISSSPNILISLQRGASKDMPPTQDYCPNYPPTASNSEYFLIEKGIDESTNKTMYAIILKEDYYQMNDTDVDIKSVKNEN